MAHPSKKFDAKLYAAAYPDVAMSGLSPKEHYDRYGRMLQRDPAPVLRPGKGILIPTPIIGDPTLLGATFSTPAQLDLQYADGVIPNHGLVKHDDLVTIIMPSYNNERWITRAIHSALSQQGVNIELIVVDDGSTDGSVTVAQKIAQDWPNMRVISLLRNFGCYYARNTAIVNAKGHWITIIDSDDIMPPDRVLRQLDALKTQPSAVACRGQQRRWSHDFLQPLSDLKFGESNLLWRRDIIETIGFFDSVRYSGDAEFRHRIQMTFGSKAIFSINDEVYYARTLDNSLTTNASSRIFDFKNGQIEVNMAPPRMAYAENFSVWHKSDSFSKKGGKLDRYIEFPLFSRPFKLGEAGQNAAPSMGHRRVGAMASFPPRRESLKKALESILPQLDELILYLNEYEDIPDFVRDPKIRVIRSQDAEGDLRDNGKFFDLPQDDESYIFTLDDDILYPNDYVSSLIHYIDMMGRSCVVGVHGVIFPPDSFTDLQQRTTYHFSHKATGTFVDLLGTGTTAWHSSTLKINLQEFNTSGICDLWFAISAAKREVPFFSVPRNKEWLKITQRFQENLYLEASTAPQNYFDVYSRYVAPVLQNGLVRRRMETHLLRGYTDDVLKAAGIEIHGAIKQTERLPIVPRRSISLQDAADFNRHTSISELLHFHVVVNGWNCSSYVDACLRSIVEQIPGPYSYETTLVDDCSDDGTYEKLVSSTLIPDAQLIRIRRNSGPAYARHIGISDIDDPETVVVLVDMDDALEPHALKTVAERYLRNPECLLTIGNWHDQKGKQNPQSFYSASELDEQRIREVELFNATHLRTFRRKLYDAIHPDDLRGPDGKWLETCTDVALMYPLLDQCRSNEVEFITEPIYRYTRQHSSGTLARFGKQHKEERLAWLKAKTPKSRLNSHQSRASRQN